MTVACFLEPAADAYCNLKKADQDLLQLGRDLQALFNQDVEITNSL